MKKQIGSRSRSYPPMVMATSLTKKVILSKIISKIAASSGTVFEWFSCRVILNQMCGCIIQYILIKQLKKYGALSN